jgi:DNA mismatch repair protein MutL
VATTLEHDGREVFSTAGSGDLESAILAVYGRDVASAMVDVESDPEADSVTTVSGLVSHPETTRAGREYLSTFVNGRYVTAGTLREAVLDAYGGQLAADRYPFTVLFVEVPPDAVDVNAHPRKMEVRFDAEEAVAAAVTDAVREALLDEGLVRSSAPRGRSAPAETEIDPESSAQEVAGGEAAGANDDEGDGDGMAADEARSVDAVAAGSGTETPDVDGERTRTSTPDEISESAGTTGRGSVSASETSETRSAPSTAEESGPRRDERDAGTGDRTADDEDATTSPSAAESTCDWRADGVVAPTDQRTLDGETATPAEAYDRLPAMRVLGQFDGTYVVAETADGLVLIDQHAADERINYERLRGEMSGETPTQALAEPVDLELTAREAELFATYHDALAELGFHADRIDDRTVEVRTVPTVFDSALDPSLLRDALTGFADGSEGKTVDAVADALLADLACYPSITGNTSLTEGSVVDLLDTLDDCENPFACPHGRPVVVAFDRGEIEDRFERDYPGHGGRRAE